MICSNAKLCVADNSGAKMVKLIRVPGQVKYNLKIGTLVRVSVIQADPKSSIKKGTLHLALVCSLKTNSRRSTGMIKFSKNAVILIGEKNAMVGTRILLPIGNEIRAKYPEIGSKAKEVY